MKFKKVNSDIIRKLGQICGDRNVLHSADQLQPYSHDEFALENIRHLPDVVVKPRKVREVSEVLKICYQENIPLTARGGGTGLCGGCVPVYGGIVLTLENMREVQEVDVKNLTATVQSGLSLRDFYAAIEVRGLFFPPHPGDDSATIGGVIATNAGGARAVKYGVIRHFIKGIEVVLPDGGIVNLGGKFMKDSSGYSLLNLMIGSEGTLGIVTEAIISLMPPPPVMVTLVASFENLHHAIASVPDMIQSKILPMAVEFVDSETISISAGYIDQTWPSAVGNAHLMVVLDGNSNDEVMAMAEALDVICQRNYALNIFVADSSARQQNILKIRSSIYEALRLHTIEILDITVPRGVIDLFVDEVQVLSQIHEMWLPTYGHAGDGNVHTHLMRSRWMDGKWHEISGWEKKYEIVRNQLHELGKKFKGTCSGEHGIGIVKQKYLPSFLDAQTLELMKGIKRIFDPKGILNPGKIFTNDF